MIYYKCVNCGKEVTGKNKSKAFPCRKGVGCTCKACGYTVSSESLLVIKVEK